MVSQLIVICGIVPLVFLTAALLAYAVMLRGQWDKLGGGSERNGRDR
jgi:hypothetical protein